MSWKVSYRSSFRKDLKKLTRKNPKLKDEIINFAKEILANPDIGEQLKGKMAEFVKFKFGKRPEMRIIYAVYYRDHEGNLPFDKEELDDPNEDLTECEGLVEFVWVKTREQMNNIYNQRRSFFENLLR